MKPPNSDDEQSILSRLPPQPNTINGTVEDLEKAMKEMDQDILREWDAKWKERKGIG